MNLNEFIERGSSARALIDVELARLRWKQRDLAEKLGVRDTTLSGYLNGAHPLPPGFLTKIEQKLKLPPGALASARKQFTAGLAVGRAGRPTPSTRPKGGNMMKKLVCSECDGAFWVEARDVPDGVGDGDLMEADCPEC